MVLSLICSAGKPIHSSKRFFLMVLPLLFCLSYNGSYFSESIMLNYYFAHVHESPIYCGKSVNPKQSFFSYKVLESPDCCR